MIPKTINIDKYSKEYCKNNPELMKQRKFWEAHVYGVLLTLYEEEAQYDEEYVNTYLDLVVQGYKRLYDKLSVESEADIEEVFYENEVESDMWDVAHSLMQQEIPQEEKYNILYNEMEQPYLKILEKAKQEKEKRELFRKNHPFLHFFLCKVSLYILILIAILWIIMTVMIETGRMENPF